MRKLIGLMLVMCTWTGLVVAQGAAAKKPAKAGSGAAEELKQVEQEWMAAQKAGDADKIAPLIADNWKALGPNGEKMDKQQYLADFKSGAQKYESIEAGPMDVHVMGNVGVVQGSDTEKSSYKGEDTSGEYVWMDVFQKKDGKWQAVRSEVTKVKK
jgi:ketosteroid isomerase-like protein